MKISLAWLRELLGGAALDGAEVQRALTMAGLEVESRTPFGALSGVVVGEVRGKRPHPNAARLTLVDVWDGQTVTQVVCGASNVPEPGAAARLVLWARPGAKLPSGVELTPKDVRGVVSPGMLCAEDELGFGSSHEGIVILGAGDDLAPGDDLARKLGLPDEILEVNVTPNRPDCLGHRGVAREVAALLGRKMVAAKLAPLSTDGPRAKVRIEDPEGCPRYSGVVVDGVTIAPSPLWARLRLLALGVRPISNVVDVTNLVMLETGQPLHAFDLDRLEGEQIVVRRAREGEELETLDGQTRKLEPDDVVIADAGRALAVAGVMGGAHSEVTASTRRLLVESAYFTPVRVRRTARRLQLHTEASHRFERGVDPAGVVDVSRRAVALITGLAGGRGGPISDEYPSKIEPRRIVLRAARTRALLGVTLDPAAQAKLLAGIGIAATVDGDRITATVPTFRPDLHREIDLIEEIARLYGYEKIPATVPTLRAAPRSSGDVTAELVRDVLRGLGLDEVVTYAFVSPASVAALALADEALPLRLANPLREEQSAMRMSLVPGLVAAAARNHARGQLDVRLFEVGEIFLPRGAGVLPEERRRVAGILTGQRDGWLRPGPPLDLFDVKGVVSELLDTLGHASTVEPSRAGWLHPGVQGSVRAGVHEVGVLGELHPRAARRLGLEERAFVFELELGLLPRTTAHEVVGLARFPQVTRDLSFFIRADIAAAQIRAAIEGARDPLCVEVRVLEDYREPGKVPAGKKGMLWSFTYRASDRTLTDAEVQAAHDRLLAALGAALPIEPR